MRLCRFEQEGMPHVGFYDEETVIPLAAVAAGYGQPVELPPDDSLIDCLPGGMGWPAVQTLAAWLAENRDAVADSVLPTSQVQLLVPVPRPNKLFLLAGNYAAHIEEGGGIARERRETFPYVFMKPPTTTLANPGEPVKIPRISPNYIDWELELGVIIGRRVKGISEQDALSAVAGYTIINDISNRKFRPNENRVEREKDTFFDWLHGKWHDGFCPCGPCVLPASELADPQSLHLTLKVNGEVKQDVPAAKMIFPVAAVIEFIASFVTLEPGDIISTGTGPGVGAASKTFLKPGDQMEAEISSIGVLRSPVAAE